MPRNISFAYTTAQVRDRTKTVTRRKGWRFLKGGEVLNGCVKCMGLKPGEKIERLCRIEVTDVRIEPLSRMIDDPEYGKLEAVREGFPDLTGEQFAGLYSRDMGGDVDQAVTRIEFKYLDDEPLRRSKRRNKRSCYNTNNERLNDGNIRRPNPPQNTNSDPASQDLRCQ